MKTSFKSDAVRWPAIEQRNRDADNHFYYGVKSTGVYCRPSCASRKPKRENVEFFSSILQAAQAGYRACKKCQPDTLPREIILIKRICNIIDSNINERMTLSTLSKKIALSPSHLQRLFKRNLGISPRQYQELRRIDQFKSDLAKGNKISATIYHAGFQSNSNAYSTTNQYLGMPPAVYQKKGAGIQISFAIFDSSLGKILIAATSKGICRIDIGNNSKILTTNLRAEFLEANIKRDDARFSVEVEKINNYLKGNHKNLNLPIDIQATAFQKKVWQALQKIPYGETRSYTQIAEKISVPHAVRAVASAIASNRIALVIPCHRVIRKNGELADYRWGVERKNLLLKKEHNK